MLDLKQKQLTPSERLKYIRKLLGATRAYFQDKYDLPEITLKSWEGGRVKLSSSAISRCVEIYRKEGLIVSEDWILEGIGLDPVIQSSISDYFLSSEPIENNLYRDDETLMMRDAHMFKESHPNAVIMLVSSDEMEPYYKSGDYIGGKVRSGTDVETALNKNCIVFLGNGERFFRRLIKNSSGGYNLVCLNPNPLTSEPVLFNADIVKVAPVIWHRCKDE